MIADMEARRRKLRKLKARERRKSRLIKEMSCDLRKFTLVKNY